MSRAHLRRPRKKTSHGSNPTPDRRTQESELVAMARRAVMTGNPMDLLILGSSLLSMTDPRRRQFERGAANPPNSPDLIESLLKSHDSDALSLALLIANLADKQDSVRQIMGRPRPASWDHPDWLRDLEPVSITEALELKEVLGDAENLVIRISTGSGYEFGLMTLIDHNLRGALSDGFVINREWASIKKTYLKFGQDPDVKGAGDFSRRRLCPDRRGQHPWRSCLSPSHLRHLARLPAVVGMGAPSWPIRRERPLVSGVERDR